MEDHLPHYACNPTSTWITASAEIVGLSIVLVLPNHCFLSVFDSLWETPLQNHSVDHFWWLVFSGSVSREDYNLFVDVSLAQL